MSYRERPAGNAAGLFSLRIKGKTSKKVSVVKPKCPSGYKKM